VEASTSTRLPTEKPDEPNNYVLFASYRLLADLTIEAYGIVRDDQAASRSRPVFLGVRSRGEPIEDLDYWFDLGYAGGRDGSTRIRGWGIDLGAHLTLIRK
jgi:hypothetical protein